MKWEELLFKTKQEDIIMGDWHKIEPNRGIMSVGENVKSTIAEGASAVPQTVGFSTLARLDDRVADLHRMTTTVIGRFSAVCGPGCGPEEVTEERVPVRDYSEQPSYFAQINRCTDEINRCLYALEDFVNRCELPD